MFTSDDLEAAGQRIARRHVEPVPLLADLERELGRRKQNARLIGGMSAATLVLVGIGALTLLSGGDDRVQIVAASPVPEAAQVLSDRVESGPKRAAGAMVVDASPDDRQDGLGTDDAAALDGPQADTEVAQDAGSGGAVGAGSGADHSEDGDGDGEDDRNTEDSDSDDQDDKKDEEERDKEKDREKDKEKDKEGSDSEHWLGFDSSGQGLLLFGDQRDGAVFSLSVATGDRAAKLAAAAAGEADETQTINGRQVWIDRAEDSDRRSRGRGREWSQAVTVSAWIDDGRFMQVSGLAKLEDMLVGLVGAGDGGLWLDSDDQWERFTDRGWLPLPPNVQDIEKWEDFDGWDEFKRLTEDRDD